MAGPDKATRDTLAQQAQQMANQTALAKATSEAMDKQGKLEFEKSMHEMGAKSTKSSGEAMKGLA